MRRLALSWVASAMLAATAIAETPAGADQVEFKGRRISQAQAAEGEPILLVGRRGVMAVLTDGVDAYCSEQTASVTHNPDGSYLLDDARLDLPGLVAAVQLRGESLHCLRIAGDRPGRSDIARLESELVEAMGFTIVLPPGK